MELKPKDFDYEFASTSIGLRPASPRSASKLMVISRETGRLQYDTFKNLAEYLKPTDLLVVNSTSVLKARFVAQKTSGGKVEGLYLSAEGDFSRVWLQGRVKVGDRIEFKELGEVEIIERSDKEALLGIAADRFKEYLNCFGFVPLPPYIRSERERQGAAEIEAADSASYQSVFAERGSSVAAPTASLHFDAELIESLRSRGVCVSTVSLCVGAGTFEPLNEDETIASQELHSEEVSVPKETQRAIQRQMQAGGRVIAVGTTVLRALESAVRQAPWGQDQDLVFSTDIFVRPGFEFKVVNGLITNFHWPKSSLLVLVASFLEPKALSPTNWKSVYTSALQNKFRLFSYGDGMLIL